MCRPELAAIFRPVDAQMVAPVNDTRTYFPVHSDPAEYRETPRSGVVCIGDECVRGAKDSWKVVIADEFSGSDAIEARVRRD